MDEKTLSHVDGDGKLQMVDVTRKEPSRRVAEARCLVASGLDLTSMGEAGLSGDVVVLARLAGIQGAKNTANLIPLCHPLALHDVAVEVVAHPRGLEVRSRVVTVERTGVEMEALSACCVAALSLLNVLLAHDAHARIDDAAVTSKSGGTSGDWFRGAHALPDSP
ncbi:MAG TPA: cyclic pyranopterin monophosphate synthase MoaC [Acidimicrobiales bacterium]